MRQIEDELRPDPWKPIRTSAIALPALAEREAATERAWASNKAVELAHKWCAAHTALNLGSSTFSEAEEQRLQNCLTKYSLSASLFQQEAALYAKRIQELEARGASRFDSLNH